LLLQGRYNHGTLIQVASQEGDFALNDFTFRGFGAFARVRVPAWVDLDRLKPWVAREVTGIEDGDEPADIELTSDAHGHRVLLGARWFGPYRDPETSLRGVASAIHYILGQRSRMTFLHAGAVVLDGRALVFPGGGRYGKSVLVDRLVKEGCGYLSDEWGVLSPEGTVFPLSKPIRLRGPDGDHYTRPRGVSLPGGFPCAALVLTRYRAGAHWDPRPVSPGQAIMRVLPCTLRGSVAPDETLQALVRVISNSLLVSTRRGDGEPMIRALDDLIRSSTDFQIDHPRPKEALK